MLTAAISGLGGTLNFVYQSAPAAIAPNLVVTDSQNVTSATVVFTNWQVGDRLNFYNSYALQHTFVQDLVANTATLTLTGSNTAAHYQTTLQSVTYCSVTDTPVPLTRSATFTVTDSLSSSSSGTQSIVITSDSPVVSGLNGSLVYLQQTAPITVAPNLSISHPDSLYISGATVVFTNWQAGDRLNFYNSYALQHTLVEDLVGHTATLTLTGISTTARYQTTLQSLVFWNVASNPVTSVNRIATFTLRDLLLNTDSATQSIAVGMPPVPVLGGIGSTSNFIQYSPPVLIAPNLTLNDGLNIASASITISHWQPGDRVDFYNGFALKPYTFVQDPIADTETVTINDVDTAAHYQTTLESFIFWSVAGILDTTTRVVTITVTDVNSNITSGTQYINLTRVNAPAVVQVNDSSSLTDTVNGTAIVVLGNVLITDPDSTTLSSLTIQITSGYQNNSNGRDVLSFNNRVGITGSFNAASGTLTLSGNTSVSNYRDALRTVTFGSSGPAVSAGIRTLTIIATEVNSATPVSSVPVTRNITVTT